MLQRHFVTLLRALTVSSWNLLIKSSIMMPSAASVQITASSLLGVFSPPCPSQLPVSLLSMFLRPLRESDKDLSSAWYPLCCQAGEKRSGSRLFLPAGFPCIPFPLQPPTLTQLNVCLLKSHCPYPHSHPPPFLHSVPPLLCSLLIAEICCRTEIKASSDLQEGHTVSQHHWQGLQTHTHIGMSRLVGELTHRGAVCLTGWLAD